MDILKVVDKYNSGEMVFSSLINSIVLEFNGETNYWAIEFFIKAIIQKNINIMPINVFSNDKVIKFTCDGKELFKIKKHEFNNYKTYDSMLKSSFNKNEDEALIEISTGKYIIGTNGIYEIIDSNKYRYVTFDLNGNIYYDAYINMKKKNIKIKYFNNNELDSIYLYSFSKSNNKILSQNDIEKNIDSFLKKEFPKIEKFDKKRLSSDLIDQYFYDLKLNNIITNEKELFVSKGSTIVSTEESKDFIYGLSIQGDDNKNKEDFCAISHPYNKDLKMLIVTDFHNSKLVNKKLATYLIEEFKNWFSNLNRSEMRTDLNIMDSLGDKVLNVNEFLNESLKSTRNKYLKKNFNDIFGSSISFALVSNDKTYLFNYGNTRIYTLNDNEFLQLTKDDTVAWNDFKDKKISYDELLDLQKYSLLTDYMGNPKSYYKLPELYEIRNDSYDSLYLFSDGITNNIDRDYLRKIAINNSSKELLREIVVRAFKNNKSRSDATGCCYVKKI